MDGVMEEGVRERSGQIYWITQCCDDLAHYEHEQFVWRMTFPADWSQQNRVRSILLQRV